ncbi:hypothetical protein Tco_1498356 [Tanacetum coccineum]
MMARLDFSSKHNMVAYLEKTDRNTEFHQIMDFLTSSSIYYALTISPIVSTSFVEQFWTTAKSRIVNNISYIDATVAGKPPDSSPRHSPSIAIPDSNPKISGGNHGGQSSNDASLSGNEDGQEAKERSQTTYHTSQSMDEDKIGKEDFSEEKGGTQGVSFDDLDDFMDVDDTLDYMETEDDQNKGRSSSVVLKEKESADKEVSTKAPGSTDKQDESTDKQNEGTNKQDGSTDSTKVSTDRQGKGTTDQNEGKSATQTAPTTTSTPTPTIFGDDETIAQVLITMSQNKQKEKEKRSRD